MSKWARPLTHALPKTQSLGNDVKTRTPQQELEGILKLQTSCLMMVGEGACALDPDVRPGAAESRGRHHDRGLAVATNTYAPRNGAATSSTGLL